MPNYDFECELDGFFERTYSMGNAPTSINCPVCDGDAPRRFAPIAVEFKGRGWGSKP